MPELRLRYFLTQLFGKCHSSVTIKLNEFQENKLPSQLHRKFYKGSRSGNILFFGLE